MPKYNVHITWKASADLTVEAPTADVAEEMVRDMGLPWDEAIEADDGDSYTLSIWEE